ncbi:leucine-rich repeat neuronal protein 1 [Neodiprion lecontei]|uniref:Leucine-rich repeat neuronal protein 1 n=1 Tax=Neodiprion lecontei TaxID=441921 RepID=A0A6J0BNE0_NEOLC|nr:leucine-rich repeat neuronal protein 1 [Neodiprion lecontei]
MWVNIIFVLTVAHFAVATDKLDLSWSGLTKEKFFRDSNGSVSSRVEKATELNLRGNFFDSFSDCAAYLDKLEILDLSQNNLQRFFFKCNTENNLASLNVSHNKLPYLNDTALTTQISKLQVLDLSYNVLQHITHWTFEHMKALHVLKLNENPLNNNIDKDAFKNLVSLVDLDLTNVSCSYFPAGLFTPLVSLRHLSLSSNPIKQLPELPTAIQVLDISRTNIISLGQIAVSHLRILRMNDMPRFECLNLTDLANLRNLTVLSADNCPNLTSLAVQPPSEDLLPQLHRLSVRNCSIVRAGRELLPVIQRVSDLDLQLNPWQCDCGTQWIISVNSTRNYSNEMRCKSPPEMREKLLFEALDSDQYDCSYYKHYLALWIALGFPLLAGIGAAIYFIVREGFGPRGFRRAVTVSYRIMITKSEAEDKILQHSDITDYP